MEPEVENFISSLVERLKSDRVFEKIEEETEKSKNPWDYIAKEKVGAIVRDIFHSFFLAQI